MPKPNKLNSRQQLRWQQQEIVGGKESEAAKIQHEEQEAEKRAQESQARSQQAVQRAHHTEMLYTYVLYVVLSIVVVFLCIARSQIKSKHVGSLQEPLLKDVDLEKDEQSEPPAAAEAALAAAQKQAEEALARAAQAEADLESTRDDAARERADAFQNGRQLSLTKK